MAINLIAAGIAIFVLAAIAVAGIRAIALRRQWLDIPNVRSSHTSVTPRGGGGAIVVLGIGASAALLRREHLLSPEWTAVFAIGAAIAAVSWVDDVRSLSSALRLSIHTAAALLTLIFVGEIQHVTVPFAGTLSLGAASAPLTLLWIVGLTNAYNFMDGIDLIAAAQASAAAAGWVLLGAMVDSPSLIIVALPIALASAGFAVHNWPPARIFMGDVGSAFLGYAFAAVPIVAAKSNPSFVACGVFLVWPFVFDASFTFLRRLRKRESVFQAHRSHLYQRLVIAGMTHGEVTFLYFLLDLLGIGCAAAVIAGSAIALPLSIALIAIAATALWLLVTRMEERRQAARSSMQGSD